jgi:putative hemolysin
MPYELLAIAILILLNGFFAGAEIATVSVRRSRIKNLAQQGRKRARLVQRSQEQPDRFLATIQVGVTLAGTTASVLAGSALVPTLIPFLTDLGLAPARASQVAVIGVVILLSYLLLVIGELVPKYLAFAFPEALALGTAPITATFARIVAWPVRFLSWSARLLLSPFRSLQRRQSGGVTEEEINLIITEGLKEGRFEEAERDLIRGVFEFAETTVRQAMTPRTEIEALPINSSRDQILTAVAGLGYSRLPIYEDSLDNIKGVIHGKDLVRLLAADSEIRLSEIIRPVSFVPDSKRLPQLLRELQQARQHLAIVLDDFGGTAGLITMEDIIEEIVGEIRDEHDTEVESFLRLDDHNCRVQARYPIADFNRDFGAKLPEDHRADTIGGYVFSQLGRLPTAGEKVRIEALEFEITKLRGTRIDWMLVRRSAED